MATGFQSTNDGPQTLAERFNGRGWSVQPTPVIPYGYDISPLAVACPTAERCLAAGGYVNNNLKVTLAETWRP